MRFDCKPLSKKVGSGDTFDVEVCFDAPQQDDHYIIEFQMVNQNQPFGEKVWCDFIVDSASSLPLSDMMNVS